MEKFKCTWGTSVRVITILTFSLLTVITIHIAYLSFTTNHFASMWVLAFVATLYVGVVSGTYLTSPTGLELKGGKIIVKRPWKDVEIDIKDIKFIGRRKDKSLNDIRTMGNGGMFAFTGRFRNNEKGRYTAYFTNTQQMVWVETRSKLYCLSCEKPDTFVQKVKSVRKTLKDK